MGSKCKKCGRRLKGKKEVCPMPLPGMPLPVFEGILDEVVRTGKTLRERVEALEGRVILAYFIQCACGHKNITKMGIPVENWEAMKEEAELEGHDVSGM